MKDNEYQCSMCGETYEKGWTEEEARKEQNDNGWSDLDCDLVCDDCYNQIMRHMENN